MDNNLRLQSLILCAKSEFHLKLYTPSQHTKHLAELKSQASRSQHTHTETEWLTQHTHTVVYHACTVLSRTFWCSRRCGNQNRTFLLRRALESRSQPALISLTEQFRRNPQHLPDQDSHWSIKHTHRSQPKCNRYTVVLGPATSMFSNHSAVPRAPVRSSISIRVRSTHKMSKIYNIKCSCKNVS